MQVPYICDLCLSTDFRGNTVAKIFQLPFPNWVWGPPMKGRCAWAWNFGPVTFDLGAMTLTLEILCTLLCPRYWCQCGQFVPVDYPWGIDVYVHDIIVMSPLTLDLWPWPWDSSGSTTVHGIDASVASLCLWTTHVHQHGIRVLWPLTLEPNLDLGILLDTPVSMVLMPTWLVGVCGLPMMDRCRWAWTFGPVTFDLGTVTLTLGFLWSYSDGSTYLVSFLVSVFYHYLQELAYLSMSFILAVKAIWKSRNQEYHANMVKHDIGCARCPYFGHLVGCLWLLPLKSMTWRGMIWIHALQNFAAYLSWNSTSSLQNSYSKLFIYNRKQVS